MLGDALKRYTDELKRIAVDMVDDCGVLVMRAQSCELRFAYSLEVS